MSGSMVTGNITVKPVRTIRIMAIGINQLKIELTFKDIGNQRHVVNIGSMVTGRIREDKATTPG
jgi:hypothetical protein